MRRARGLLKEKRRKKKKWDRHRGKGRADGSGGLVDAGFLLKKISAPKKSAAQQRNSEAGSMDEGVFLFALSQCFIPSDVAAPIVTRSTLGVAFSRRTFAARFWSSDFFVSFIFESVNQSKVSAILAAEGVAGVAGQRRSRPLFPGDATPGVARCARP